MRLKSVSDNQQSSSALFLGRVFGRWQIPVPNTVHIPTLMLSYLVVSRLFQWNKKLVKNIVRNENHRKCKVFETMKVQFPPNCTWFFVQCLHASTISYKGRQETLKIKTKYQKHAWLASAVRIWPCDETVLRVFSAVFHTSSNNAIHQEKLIAEDNIATSKQDLPFLL